MRKGLNEKLKRISNISSSNVSNQLQLLLDDLLEQKQRLTDNNARKKKRKNSETGSNVDDFSSDNDSDNSNNNNRNGYIRTKEVGTEPDNLIFDLA